MTMSIDAIQEHGANAFAWYQNLQSFSHIIRVYESLLQISQILYTSQLLIIQATLLSNF